MSPRAHTGLLRGFVDRYREADLGMNAAAVAYHTFLALAPLGVALLGVAALVGDSEAALERVNDTLVSIAPDAVRRFIIDLLREASDRIGGGREWLIVGSVLLTVVLGSRAAMALQRALAEVEDCTEKRPALQMRLVAVALTIGGGAVLLAASILLVAGSHVVDFVEGITGLGFLSALWPWLQIPIPAAGLYVFLLAFYRWAPPEPLPKAWLAALVGTIGALGSSLLFGLYVNLAPGLGAAFGVLGAVALALVWLYLGAFAILLGAVAVCYVQRWRSGSESPAA
jgi:membrane protein